MQPTPQVMSCANASHLSLSVAPIQSIVRYSCPLPLPLPELCYCPSGMSVLSALVPLTFNSPSYPFPPVQSPCCQSQPLSSSQSVELIEAEFNRIMEHCQQQQQQTGVLCHNHQQAPGSAAVGVVEQQTVPGADEEPSLEFED